MLLAAQSATLWLLGRYLDRQLIMARARDYQNSLREVLLAPVAINLHYKVAAPKGQYLRSIPNHAEVLMSGND